MSLGNIAISIKPQIQYGAQEIKRSLKRYTFISFGNTIALISVLLLVIWSLNMVQDIRKDQITIAPQNYVPIDIIHQVEPPISLPVDAPKFSNDFATLEKAGNPKPITDKSITDNLKDYATWDNLATSLSKEEGKITIDINEILNKVDLEIKETKISSQIVQEKEFEGNEVEIEPNVDLESLAKSIVYPDMARNMSLEGRVIIRVLVGKDGKPLKSEILSSDSSILEKAALNASAKAIYTPAIQNGTPVNCWLNIPVQFRLK
jgi:TonB family protein